MTTLAKASRTLINEAVAMDGVDPADFARARYFTFAETGDWHAAAAAAKSYRDGFLAENEPIPKLWAATFATPLLAVALAHTGNFAAAHAVIDATPGDCVPCETARGDIDALTGNAGGAAFWYAGAVRDAPSIPFAYANWGAMLLHEGRFDAAIAKFRDAKLKGP